MCLRAEGLSVIEKPTKDEVLAWKVFRSTSRGGLESEIFGGTRARGRWLLAISPGWHAFKRYSDAVAWRDRDPGLPIVKVRLRHVTHTGLQDLPDGRVALALVAREMFIPKASK